MREDFQKDFLKLFRSYGTVSSLSIDYIINYLSIVTLITRVRDVDVKKKIKIFGNKFKLELTWSTTLWSPAVPQPFIAHANSAKLSYNIQVFV